MISIITSIHNQLGMNKLFYKYLKEKTNGEFELIIVDNMSTDGSREFFEERADKVIVNKENYSYPVCQNQGIAAATGDYLAFFNNDLILSSDWDTRILQLMDERALEVVSFASNDFMEHPAVQHRVHKTWKYIKYPLRTLFGTNYASLYAMFKLMYPNWDRFCEERYRRFGNETVEGFSGSSIFMKRSVLDKIGLWDERIQTADFDLFCRTKQRFVNFGDINPIQVALGIYFHHYQRLTLRSKPMPFADALNMISLPEKWGGREKELLRDVGMTTTIPLPA